MDQPELTKAEQRKVDAILRRRERRKAATLRRRERAKERRRLQALRRQERRKVVKERGRTGPSASNAARESILQERERMDRELLQLLESLPGLVRVADDGPYTYVDRARDFLAVFNGTSDAEQGRRVLSQIHRLLDPPALMSDAEKPGTLAGKNGMRAAWVQIQACFIARPPITVQRSHEDAA